MKKILFLFALVMATAFVSCGNTAANETASDSAVVNDSTVAIDSAVVSESLASDTLK